MNKYWGSRLQPPRSITSLDPITRIIPPFANSSLRNLNHILKMLSSSPSVTILALLSTPLILLLAWLTSRLRARLYINTLPRVGINPGILGFRSAAAKAEFFTNGQKLLEKGYAQYKDTPYIIQTCDNERLVVPDKFINELKNLPDTALSFKAELLDRFIGKYTGLDAVKGTDIHREVVRGPLTKNLGMYFRPQPEILWVRIQTKRDEI